MRISMGAALIAAVTLAMSGVVSSAQAKDCDRDCLNGMVDTYIAAMLAHDPGKAPFAKNSKTVENIKRIQPGDGLWKTITAGPDKFKIYVPDPVSQQVGFMGMIEDGGKPAQLGLRLKIENGKIVEAEQMIAYPREASLKNLQEPRRAFHTKIYPGYDDSRDRMIYIAKSYYDALDLNNGSLAPFADDCERHENGMQTTGLPPRVPKGMEDYATLGVQGCAAQLDSQLFQYIDTIDDRRVMIADTVTGLAIGFSHFHHSFKTHEFPRVGIPGVTTATMDFKPFDLPAMHIFKIWGGKIHEIEAVGISAPYNSPTGWEDDK
jgi:hypothetical protein